MTTKKEDIMGLIGARQEDESCLTFTYSSESKLAGDGVSTKVTLPGGFDFTIDEPEAFPGGSNAGPNPLDVMCASLGTCQEITYKLYATVMDIDLKSVSASVDADINLSGFVGVGEKVGFSGINVDITIDAPDASDEQLDALKGAVDAHCPLVATLVNPLDLTTKVVKAEPTGSTEIPQKNLVEGVMALIGAAKEDDKALQSKYSSSSVLNGDGLLTTATLTGGHTIIVDEPTTMPGGTNKGTNPLDLFCASFGTCQEITYKYYGQVMGVHIQSISCKVEAPIDLGGLVGLADDAVGLKSMTGTITIESSASQEELEKLKEAVDAHCPLVDTFKTSTPVNLSWKRPSEKK